MPDVCAKSQVYPVKVVNPGRGVNVVGYPTADANQVRSSVPDPVRKYDRGGTCSPAMKKVSFKKASKFGRMK